MVLILSVKGAIIPYSGLILRGQIFVNWIVKTFCGYIFEDYN